MKILGIETSCDETAASVIEISRGRVFVLSNVISSQIKIHQQYGGVVPELAARQHTENIIPVVDQALTKVKGQRACPELAEGSKIKNSVDAIAVTAGPGLITSLMVGVETAKTLAWAWKKPLIAVNHLEAHLYANWLNPPTPLVRGARGDYLPAQFHQAKRKLALAPLTRGVGGFSFPVLCLLVSGGHSELILMTDHGKYKIVGETLDDAAGEAFDKIAKMLEIPYPGGPNVARLAEQGDAKAIDLPRPLINSGDFNFSFSGLKSAVHRVLEQDKKTNLIAQRNPPTPLVRGARGDYLPAQFNQVGQESASTSLREKKVIGERFNKTKLVSDLVGNITNTNNYHQQELRTSSGNDRSWGVSEDLKRNICASFQQAVIDSLIYKTIKAAEYYKVKTVIMAGGVSANQELRRQLSEKIKTDLPKITFFYPSLEYCTDNATMIAMAGYFKYNKKLKPYNLEKIEVDPNWGL